MIAWMMYAVVIAALVGIAALLAERGARRAGVAGRWMWAGALALSLAIPIVALLRPVEREVRATEPWATAELEATSLDPSLVATGDRSLLDAVTVKASAMLEVAGRARDAVLARASNAPANRAALVLWALASVAMLAAIIVAALRLAAARREWELALLDEQFVRVSEDTGPAVVGFLRGEIVVPEWALELAPERRDMLLAHEREHLQARDPLMLLGALGALVLMPWNPAMWWQVRRLRLAVEMDCDRRVLRRGGDVRAYGALLIEVGRRSARTPLAAAAFSEPATHLERRIHMMLARTPRWGLLRATVLAVAGAGIVLVACDMQPPTGVSPENEVALASLDYTSRSYNVKEGSVAADIRAAIEAYHPELLQDQAGRKFLVQLVLDPDGRIISTGRTPERRSRTVALTEVEEATAGRLRVALRVPEGEMEVVRDRAAAAGAVLARTATTDTMVLQADRMTIQPVQGRVLMREVKTGELEARPLMRETRQMEVEPRSSDAPADGNKVTARGRIQQSVQPPEGSLELDKIDTDRIESIEVIKGGAITGLSPAVSGVIVIRMKW